jgi:hypothetical protein
MNGSPPVNPISDVPAAAFDLVEIGGHFGRRQVDQPVVFWGPLNIAILGGEIGKCASVEPQRLQRLQRDMRSPFAFRGEEGVLELAEVMTTGP